MTTYRELVNALRMVASDRTRPVLVHASLSAFGEIAGGAETVVGALVSTYNAVIAPAFTYQTMLIPEAGPPDNGLVYGSGREQNAYAEFFRPDLSAHASMGVISEALRRLPDARRSDHPILSFAGVHADLLLQAQTLQEPLAPIRLLTEQGGTVLLLGVDHTRNTAIHLAEALAGRKQFIRWALTPRGVVECPAFPGCSDGFEAIAPHLEGVARWTSLGEAKIQAVPLRDLVQIARRLIQEDPQALLCEREGCERCEASRQGHAGEYVRQEAGM
jgi:aminoglycoside 3-N-acetyltransferase